MTKVYTRRYKILTGPLTDRVFSGQYIGAQEYPDQVTKEGCAMDNWNGIWLDEAGVKIIRSDDRRIELTDEGVNYSDDYLDLCVPYDRFGAEIFIGDTLYVSCKGEVVPGVVEKIAKKPFMASYGIVSRKLTVRPVGGGTALTIHDPRSTIKSPKI